MGSEPVVKVSELLSAAQLPAALAANGGMKVEGVAGGVAVPVSGSVTVATHAVTVASGGIASGAVASGAVAAGAMVAGSQVDGHSLTLGATADADTALTVVGRLKKLIALLPIALGTGGGLKVDGSGTALPVSFTQAALVAGEAHIGAVGGATVPIIVTPTLTVGATYAANDFVGTNNTAMTFANATRVAAGSGRVIGATLIDYVAASVAAELWLFSAAPAGLGLDSAAFTITDADALLCIGVIPFASYYASALNSISNGSIPNGQLPFKLPAAATSLFGALVTRGAPAYTNGLVSVRIAVDQD